MHAAAEEHTGGTVKLGYYDTLGTVDDERAVVRHVGDEAQEYVLNHCVEVFMIGVVATQFQFCLQGHTVGEVTLQTLLDGIARGVNEIIEKLQIKVVARVVNREILREDLVQTVILPQLRRSIQLEEVLERLQLHFQKVGVCQRTFNGSEIYSLNFFLSHLNLILLSREIIYKRLSTIRLPPHRGPKHSILADKP